MERRIVMWGIVAVLFLAVLYMTFKTGSASAATEITATSQIDTTGWTENEIMNYEMHGTIPARAQGSAPSTSAGSGMVGGC